MRVKNVKQVGVRQSLLLAGLILASAGAQAAVLPKITITGVVGNSVTTQDVVAAIRPESMVWQSLYVGNDQLMRKALLKVIRQWTPIFLVWFYNHWVPNRVDYTFNDSWCVGRFRVGQPVGSISRRSTISPCLRV